MIVLLLTLLGPKLLGGGTTAPQVAGAPHGSSAPRKQWFNSGYETGDTDRCNLFA